MPDKFRILSIDGGGIRGIIPAQVLVNLEKKLQEAKNDNNVRLADHFDMIAGTSTGGIIACALLLPENDRPKFTAEEIVELYFDRGDDIFDYNFFRSLRSVGGFVDEKYSEKGMEEALEDYFEDAKLSDLLKPSVIASYDIKNREGKFFNSYNAKNHKKDDFYLRDVARATSAAPTYFECAQIKSMSGVKYPLVDGGVFANNPALASYAETRRMKPELSAKNMVILSLGTGHAKKQYHHSEAKNWGVKGWIRPLLDIMMSGVSDTVHEQLELIFGTTETPDNYLRVNTKLGSDINADMDDASMDNMNALRDQGQKLAEDYDSELDRIVELVS